ncbi:MAG: hypothetical protein R3B68_15490 [Phycisphaerales bacterium]
MADQNASIEIPVYLADFLDRVLVRCPRCGGAARAGLHEPEVRSPHGHTEAAAITRGSRLTCGGCGYVHEEAARPTVDAHGCLTIGSLRVPLFLRTPCCGETLWAINEEHLDWLQRYVAAALRPRSMTESGRSNTSLQSRLPRWIVVAKNRDEVIGSLARLRELLGQVL